MLKLCLLGVVGSAAVRMESRDVVISILEQDEGSFELLGREKWSKDSKDSNDWVLLHGLMIVAFDKDKSFSVNIVEPFARDILQSGQSPNVQHVSYWPMVTTTPLCNAVYFKQQGVVRELLFGDADPNLSCQSYSSPMPICTFRRVIGIESFQSLADLLDAGATISQGNLADAKTSVELDGTPSGGHYELLAYSFHVREACRNNEKLKLRPPEESHQYFDIYPSVFSTDEKGQCALSYALQYKNTRNIIFCLRYGLKFVKHEGIFSPGDLVPVCGLRIKMLLKFLFPEDRIRACAMLIKSCKSFVFNCPLFRILPQDLILKCILTPDVVWNLKTVDHNLRHNEDIAMMVAGLHALFCEIQQLHEAPEYLDSVLSSLKMAINYYIG